MAGEARPKEPSPQQRPSPGPDRREADRRRSSGRPPPRFGPPPIQEPPAYTRVLSGARRVIGNFLRLGGSVAAIVAPDQLGDGTPQVIQIPDSDDPLTDGEVSEEIMDAFRRPVPDIFIPPEITFAPKRGSFIVHPMPGPRPYEEPIVIPNPLPQTEIPTAPEIPSVPPERLPSPTRS